MYSFNGANVSAIRPGLVFCLQENVCFEPFFRFVFGTCFGTVIYVRARGHCSRTSCCCCDVVVFSFAARVGFCSNERAIQWNSVYNAFHRIRLRGNERSGTW